MQISAENWALIREYFEGSTEPWYMLFNKMELMSKDHTSIEFYPCTTCGAYTEYEKTLKHAKWHKEAENQVEKLTNIIIAKWG
jgi:hypothetical protein